MGVAPVVHRHEADECARWHLDRQLVADAQRRGRERCVVAVDGVCGRVGGCGGGGAPASPDS